MGLMALQGANLHGNGVFGSQLRPASLEQNVHEHHVLLREAPPPLLQAGVHAPRWKEAARVKLGEQVCQIRRGQGVSRSVGGLQFAGQLRGEIGAQLRCFRARGETGDEGGSDRRKSVCGSRPFSYCLEMREDIYEPAGRNNIPRGAEALTDCQRLQAMASIDSLLSENARLMAVHTLKSDPDE